MSKQKHTPSPWKVNKWERENYTDGFEYIVTDSRGLGIVTLCQKGENETTKANARLIGAAPELLKACKQLRQELHDIHAAINGMGLIDKFQDDSINMLSEGQTAIQRADTTIAKAEGREG